ncbi:MAG: hypothetical protein K6B72_11595, partial [Lachnospiraceae bacterium]|nr:hypothetical protein [Lachnospiraceae bacterium]
SHEEQAAIAQLAEKMRSYAQKEYESRLYDGPEGLLKEIRMENIFSTSFSKKALIVYILSPFYYPESEISHTNVREVRAMSDTLRELGYDVDVVNSYYAGEVDAGRYDLLIGFRRPFEELLPRVRKECISVYYTTEASPYFANPAELKRILYFEERNGRRLSYERQNHACLDLERLQLADGAICIGNDWALSTYRGMFRRCFRQNVSSTELKRDAAHKA